MLLACAALLVVAGCNAESQPNGRASNGDLSAPANETPTNASERDAVVAAYKDFWVRLRHLEDQPKSEWEDYLGEVAVDPQLRISLQATGFQLEQGVTLYGEVITRITDVDIDGDEATVEDCQDTSKTGQADAETGERKTVGVERAPTRARMERSDAGEWKVAEVTHPDGEC